MNAALTFWPALLQGMWVTVWLSVCMIIGSAFGAVALGALKLSRSAAIRGATKLLIECARGPSALVLLFWVFYALPLVQECRVWAPSPWQFWCWCLRDPGMEPRSCVHASSLSIETDRWLPCARVEQPAGLQKSSAAASTLANCARFR